MSKTILAQVDGFTPVIDSVVLDIGAMPAMVFGKMWRYCQMSDGVCKAAQERIASELGLSRATVNAHISKLLIAGYLIDTTPDLAGLPHIYADSGKAGLSISLTTTCQNSLQPPVEIFDTKKEIKTDSKKDIVAEKMAELKFKFNANTGTIIQGWKDDFSDDVILRAIGEAVGHHAYNIAYVESVLVGWKEHGVPPTREEKAAARKQAKNKQSLQDLQTDLAGWLNQRQTQAAEVSYGD